MRRLLIGSMAESSFTDFVVGAKIRFTGPNNPLGFGSFRSIAGIQTRQMMPPASISFSAARVPVATSATSA